MKAPSPTTKPKPKPHETPKARQSRIIDELGDSQKQLLDMLRSGKTPRQIIDETGVVKPTLHNRIRALIKSGHIDKSQVHYTNAKDVDWYSVIQRTGEELGFYESNGITEVTVRMMYYRLIELGVITKTKSNYGTFDDRATEARRGYDATYTIPANLPSLPMNCFVDDTRQTWGDTDASEPSDPTPDEAPEEPIEFAAGVYKETQDKIVDYDGLVTKDDKGEPPGKWYMQPIYPHIICESLLLLQRDKIALVVTWR